MRAASGLEPLDNGAGEDSGDQGDGDPDPEAA